MVLLCFQPNPAFKPTQENNGEELGSEAYRKFNEGVSNSRSTESVFTFVSPSNHASDDGSPETFPCIGWDMILALFFGFDGAITEKRSGPLPQNFWRNHVTSFNTDELVFLLKRISSRIVLARVAGSKKFCIDERKQVMDMLSKPVAQSDLDHVFSGLFFTRIKQFVDVGLYLDTASGEIKQLQTIIDENSSEQSTPSRLSTGPVSIQPQVELWKGTPQSDDDTDQPPFHLMVMNNVVTPSLHRWIWEELNSHPLLKMKNPGSTDRLISVATTLPNKNSKTYFVIGKPGANTNSSLHCYQLREETFPHDVVLLNLANYVLGLYGDSVEKHLSENDSIVSRAYQSMPVTMKIETFSPSNNIGYGSHSDSDITNTRNNGENFRDVPLPLEEELMTLTMIFCDPQAYSNNNSQNRNAPGKTKYVYTTRNNDVIPLELCDSSKNVGCNPGGTGQRRNQSISIGYNSLTLQGPGSQSHHHKVALLDPTNIPSNFVRVAVTFRWAAMAAPRDPNGNISASKVCCHIVPDLWSRIRSCMDLTSDNIDYHSSYLQFKQLTHKVMSSMTPMTPQDYDEVAQFGKRRKRKRSKKSKTSSSSEQDSELHEDDDREEEEENGGEEPNDNDDEIGSETLDTDTANENANATDAFNWESFPLDMLKRAPKPFHHCDDISKTRPPIMVKTEASKAEIMQHWEVSRSLLLEKKINIRILKTKTGGSQTENTNSSFDLMLRDDDGLLMVPGNLYKYHRITKSGGMTTKDVSFANPLCSTSEEHPKVFVLTKPYKSEYASVVRAIRSSLEFKREIKKRTDKASAVNSGNAENNTETPFSGLPRLPGLTTYGSGGSDATGLNHSPDLSSLSVTTEQGLNRTSHAPTIVIGKGQPFGQTKKKKVRRVQNKTSVNNTSVNNTKRKKDSPQQNQPENTANTSVNNMKRKKDSPQQNQPEDTANESTSGA